MSNLRKKLEEQIIEKAMKDDSFRKKLIDNPKLIFELETGINLPETIKIKILQEDQKTVYLVLPPFRGDAAEDELTEAELASVAGGTGWGGARPGIIAPASTVSAFRAKNFYETFLRRSYRNHFHPPSFHLDGGWLHGLIERAMFTFSF